MEIGDITFLCFIIFAVIYVITLLTIGILLLVRSRKTHLRNLIYGGIGFILASITQLLEQLFDISFLIEILLIRTGTILAVIFTNSTFHREKKEKLPNLILLATIILTVFSAILYFLKDISNSQALYYLIIMTNFIFLSLVYGWLGCSSYSAYKVIKQQDIEPWVKARYKITSLYSFIIIPRPLIQLLKPWDVDWIACNDLPCLLSAIIAGIITLSFSVTLTMTWLMPGWFKNYLNKGYKPSKKGELDKSESVQMINYLGDFLAEKIKFSSSATRGLIKLAVKDQLGAFKLFEQITLKDFKSVIKGSLMKRLLELKDQDKIKIDDIDGLIGKLIDQLIRGQALLTMANV